MSKDFIGGAIAGALTAYIVSQLAGGRVEERVIVATSTPPVFDYVVDVYSEKVVITASDGTTTQLPTVADFNSWLSNITGKKIRINMKARIDADFFFTPNEYWIFGEPVDGTIYLLEGKHTVVSMAYISYITNWRNWTTYDVSGSRIYIATADSVWITGSSDRPVRNILLVVGHAGDVSLEHAEGDYYASGEFVHSAVSVLRNMFLNATYLCLEGIEGRNREGVWVAVSHVNTCDSPIDVKNVYRAELRLTSSGWLYVGPGYSQEFYLPEIHGSNWAVIKTLQVGVERCSEMYCTLDPLPEGISYAVNLDEGKIVITNNTDSGLDVDIIVEVIAVKYW
jgi:hypothetical protein